MGKDKGGGGCRMLTCLTQCLAPCAGIHNLLYHLHHFQPVVQGTTCLFVLWVVPLPLSAHACARAHPHPHHTQCSNTNHEVKLQLSRMIC